MEPFFEKGDDREIANAKKEYRRIYKATWRKEHRKQQKEITLSWSKDEYRIIKKEATRHNESITRFIKEAALAYTNQRFIVPEKEKVTKVIQLLAMTYNSIEEMQMENSLDKELGKSLQNEVASLEREIRVLLFSPNTIEKTITEYLHSDPGAKANLLTFLQTL